MTRAASRAGRKVAIRRRVHGSSGRPRLSVFRSHREIYAQVIDDDLGQTICSASTIDKDLRGDVGSLKPVEAAKAVGKVLGERAKAAGVERVVFDRGGYKFHGRVAALAEGAREALEF